MKQLIQCSLVGIVVLALGVSFHRSEGWLQLCAGLALFLFGMQCLETGLKQLAGSGLQRLLARSTATPLKGLLFGGGATMLLQSSTLVSLLTIAFLGTGLIQLGGAIAVLLGANLGATSGIWLLALAGQGLSLSSLALPLLVFGVLARYTGKRGAAASQLVVGIAFLFLAIEQIQHGFAAMTRIDLAGLGGDGVAGTLLMVLAGALLTVVVQSSHATLMLTLAALATGQLAPAQSLAIAIGSNVGSSLSTAAMGFVGSNRAGQRLALAHVVFNLATAVVALLTLPLLQALVLWLTGQVGMGSNALIQLALFHSLFNALGVALFWPWQAAFARGLQRVLPERTGHDSLVGQLAAGARQAPSPHLGDAALHSADTATLALRLELQRLGRLSLEVIGQALYCPPDQIDAPLRDGPLLRQRVADNRMDSDALYRQLVKPIWAGMLQFVSRFEQPLDPRQQQHWRNSQQAAAQLVEAVKDAHALQANLQRQLHPDNPDALAAQAWLELRWHLLGALARLRQAGMADGQTRYRSLQQLEQEQARFARDFSARLFSAVRQEQIDGVQLGSLFNDLGYAKRILANLQQVLLLGSHGHMAEETAPWHDDASMGSPQATAMARR